jgi:hypothetical protein
MFTKLKNHTFTLGIEGVLILIRETQELRSHIRKF